MNTEGKETGIVIDDARLDSTWAGLSKKVAGIEMLLHWKEAAMLNILASEVGATGHIVEIGGWMGGSTCIIGNACKDRGIPLVTVDHWADRVVNQIYPWNSDIFDTWYGNLKKGGVDGIVIPIRGESFEVVKVWWYPIAMLFIDGGHFDGIPQKDLAAWTPFVSPGGIVAIHDDFKPDVAEICKTLEDQPETWTVIGKIETMRVYQRVGEDDNIVRIPNPYAQGRLFDSFPTEGGRW